MASPPPPPPGTAVAPFTRRLHIRRWWIEAVAALVLLGVLAAVFQPGTPAPPDPARQWLTSHGRAVDALAADVATVEGQLSSPMPAALVGLRRDLLVAGRTPPPPGLLPQRAWAEALGRIDAAATLLQSRAVGPVERAEARDDLAAAADGLVAVMQAGGKASSFYPH